MSKKSKAPKNISSNDNSPKIIMLWTKERLNALSDQQLINLLENAKRGEVSEIVDRCEEILNQRKNMEV
jgi:DNA polymerase III gamma/tau subunit